MVARIGIEDTLTPGLARLIEAGRDLTEPMAQISEAVFSHTLDRFQAQYSPEGVPWEPSRRAMRTGGRTLFDRGDLYNSLERISGPDFAMVGVLETGGPARYARVHQEGFTGTVDVPAHTRTSKRHFTTKAGTRSKNRRTFRQEIGAGQRRMSIIARPFLGIEVRDMSEAERIVFSHLGDRAGGEA
jgi:phage gpG-like protein